MRATVAHDSDLQELMRGTEVLIENSKHLCHSSARAIEKSKRLVREIEASRQGANGDTPKEPSKMNARAPLLVLTNSCPWRIRAVRSPEARVFGAVSGGAKEPGTSPSEKRPVAVNIGPSV